MHNILSKTFWLSIRQVSLRGGFIIASIILSNGLSLRDFANYSFFLATTNLLASYATLGIGISATTLFAGMASNRPQNYPISALILVFVGLLGSICLIVLLIPGDALLSGLDLSKYLLILGLVAFALDALPGGGAMGLESYKNLAVVSSLNFLLLLFGTLGAAYSGSYVLAIWVLILTALFRAAGSLIILKREIVKRRLQFTTSLSAQTLKSAFNFVGPMALVTILSASGLWFGAWIHLNQGVSNYQYPQYVIGLQWFGLGLFIPQLVSQTIIPRMILLDSGHTGDISARTFLRAASLTALLSSIVVCSISALASLILKDLYGGILANATLLLPAFLLAAVPYSIVNTVGNALVAKGDQWHWLFTSFLFQATFQTFNLLFVVQGAIMGAVAISIAGIVQGCLVLLRARKLKLL